MLHGLLGSTFTYRRVQQLVADSLNGQVVSFDMPGFGLTERPNPLLWKLFGAKESPYSFRHASALTAQVIDACRLKRTVLFGHSLGGSVALDAVLNGAPVDALVLFSPAAKIPSVPRFLKRMINSVLSTPVVGNIAVRRSVHRMVELEIEEMVRRNFHDLSRISMEETVAGYTAPMKVHNWDTALRDFSIHFDGFNFLDDERLQALTIPTLVSSSPPRLLSKNHPPILRPTGLEARNSQRTTRRQSPVLATKSSFKRHLQNMERDGVLALTRAWAASPWSIKSCGKTTHLCVLFSGSLLLYQFVPKNRQCARSTFLSLSRCQSARLPTADCRSLFIRPFFWLSWSSRFFSVLIVTERC